MDKVSLLREILGPLLDDYHYWFERSRQLLEREPLPDLLSSQAQADLLQQVREAQAELQAAETLYGLSDNQVGIDPGLMAKWHRLLMECAEIGRQYYQLRNRTDP